MYLTKIFKKYGKTILPTSLILLTLATSTTALTQQIYKNHIEIQGKDNTFNLEFSTNPNPSWTPNPTNDTWYPGGNATPISIQTLPDIPPGTQNTNKIAIKNTSTTASGNLNLTIIKPQNSNENKIFNQLNIAIEKNNTTLIENTANNITSLPLGNIKPKEIITFTITMHFPNTLDDSYKNLKTPIQLQITGQNL